MTHKGIALITALLLTALLVGCEEQSSFRRPRFPERKMPAQEARHLESQTVAGDAGGHTAVESAMQWAEKYAQAAKELIVVNKRLQEMEKEQKVLQTRLAKAQSENEALKREIRDANAMLGAMKQELKEWRQNVLGFRSEMLASQKAQLQAMQRIMQLLGGEMARPEENNAGRPLSAATP